jgi:hypothetical protein
MTTMISAALTTLAALALGAVFARPKGEYGGPLPRKHAERRKYVDDAIRAFNEAHDARAKELHDESVRNGKERDTAIAAYRGGEAQMLRDLHDTLVRDWYAEAAPLVASWLAKFDLPSSEAIREAFLRYVARAEEEIGEPVEFHLVSWALADAVGVHSICLGHQDRYIADFMSEHRAAANAVDAHLVFFDALRALTAVLARDAKKYPRCDEGERGESRRILHDSGTLSALRRARERRNPPTPIDPARVRHNVAVRVGQLSRATGEVETVYER